MGVSVRARVGVEVGVALGSPVCCSPKDRGVQPRGKMALITKTNATIRLMVVVICMETLVRKIEFDDRQ
jgi:hypothetical protein